MWLATEVPTMTMTEWNSLPTKTPWRDARSCGGDGVCRSPIKSLTRAGRLRCRREEGRTKIRGAATKRSAAPVGTMAERSEQAAIFASPECHSAAGTHAGGRPARLPLCAITDSVQGRSRYPSAV